MAFLITEDNFKEINSGSVIEESTGKKDYFIEGIYLQAEQKNRNGRIYPTSILEREVDRFSRDYIANKRSLGELNHPQEPSVNPERACHLIESLRKDGDNWIGKSKVLSTPVGTIVKGLLDDGVQLGVSSRGLGTLREDNGIKYVNEDFYMSTIDVVSDPSAKDAWVNGILENREFYVDGNEELVDKIKKQLDKEASKTGFSMIEEHIIESAFKTFMININK